MVLSYHVSRLTFFSRYVAVLALLILGIAFYQLNNSYTILIPFILLAVAGFLLLKIKTRNHKILLTPETIIIVESGVFSKNSTKINYRSISDTRVRQSFWQRIFNYGDVEIGVPGANLQQNFSGKGDITVNATDMRPGIVLKNFQKINEIEHHIVSRISETRPKR